MKSLKQPFERRPQALRKFLTDSTALKTGTQSVGSDEHSGHPSLSRYEDVVAKVQDLVTAD
jgi:hypothetical protein